MFKSSVRLFRLWGIPVELNVSWVLVLVLVVSTFATGYFPESYPGVFTGLSLWILSLLTALMLFASILIHEFSHSLVAMRNGLKINKITLFMFGGVASMSREVDDPHLELKIAAAGPAMTLLLIGVYLLLAWLSAPVFLIKTLFVTVAGINIGIFIFNMVPGFPLDGGRILRSILWMRKGEMIAATRTAGRIGSGFAILLIGLGVVNILFQNNLISGAWMIFIGFFLKHAASTGYRNAAFAQILAERKVSDIMRREPVSVDGSLDLETLVEEYFLRYRYDSFPVVIGGRFAGLVKLEDFRDIARDRWSDTAVAEVIELPRLLESAEGSDPAEGLYRLIMGRGYSLVPVTDEKGSIVGIVTRQDLLDALK